MSVKNKDIIIRGSATMPEDEVTQQIGGAEDVNIKVHFGNLDSNDGWECVSSHVSDNMNVTVYSHLANGADNNEAVALNGQTPAAYAGTHHCLLKAIKASLSANGDIAVMAVTDENTGTAQAGGDDYIDLDSGASANEGTYDHMVIRLLNDSPAGVQYALREIIYYEGGANRRAWLNKDWGTNPTSATTYEIALGVVFDLGPASLEIDEVRSIFYNVAAEPAGGSEVIIYEKFFIHNKHATLALNSAVLTEVAVGGSAFVDFDVESSVDGSDDNGAGNERDIAPGGYTFDSNADDLGDAGDGILEAGESQGVWLKCTLAAGTSGQKTYWKCQVAGQSIG